MASGGSFDTCIENIDIGGPSMLRSAAKNHAYVSVLTSPSQYAAFAAELQANAGAASLAARRRLAAAAFALSASYDASIAQYFAATPGADGAAPADQQPPVVGQRVTRSYECVTTLKYGCNPHQKPAAVHRSLAVIAQPANQTPFRILNGTPGA